MQSDVLFLFCKICFLHDVVAVLQGQIVNMKFAQCWQKCFCITSIGEQNARLSFTHVEEKL